MHSLMLSIYSAVQLHSRPRFLKVAGIQMTLTTRIEIKQPAEIRFLYPLFVLALVIPEATLFASSFEKDKRSYGEIRQIDQMYNIIKTQIGTDNLIELERKFKYCEPY